MNFPFLSSFLKKNVVPLELPESLLLKKLKQISIQNNLPIFQNITLYHHNQKFLIPLLIADENRGIFLFEYKDWSYDDLKNAKIEKATNQETSHDTLAYEKSHEFIKKRFNELTHSADIPIFNYLLMENLNTNQYKNLDSSFQELLPYNKVMFNDSSLEDISGKMFDGNRVLYNLPNVSNIMSILLTQYSILDDKNQRYLASQEQIDFIDSPLVPFSILKAIPSSGKTSTILLKIISEKLKNSQLKVLIIKPNNLACDILKKKLLNMIESAIVEINPAAIEIITPNEFAENTPKHIDLLICDDSWAYSTLFINNLRKMKNKKHLILVETTTSTDTKNNLNKPFKDRKVIFHQTNQHAKALQIIGNLLKTYQASDILVIGNNLGRVQLKDDLEDFIDDNPILLDTTKKLLNQNLDGILLSSYDDIYQSNPKFVILMNVCFADTQRLKYAYNLSTVSTYILYDTESDNLTLLRNDFENKQNS